MKTPVLSSVLAACRRFGDSDETPAATYYNITRRLQRHVVPPFGVGPRTFQECWVRRDHKFNIPVTMDVQLIGHLLTHHGMVFVDSILLQDMGNRTVLTVPVSPGFDTGQIVCC